MATQTPAKNSLARYVPRLNAEWDLQTDDNWRTIEGTLCYIDISGFTALSERLARRGRIGAEELTDVLNYVFGRMLGVAYDRGGSLLKFGGDALLLVFRGVDHPIQACSAAVEMQDELRKARTYETSAGRLRLKMSVGIHSGTIQLFRVGGSHKELILTGPAATVTTEMEEAAEAGEILVSSATKAALPSGSANKQKGGGWLLSWRKARLECCGWSTRIQLAAEAIAAGLPTVLRSFLEVGSAESEHRIATVGFIRFEGVDALMAAEGPARVAEELDALVRRIQEAADAEEVTFLATDIDQDGGKVILVAGVPGSHEDDEGRVLRASRRVADGSGALTTKIGVNRGHVFVGEIGTDFRATYTIMGDTVNLAARLMAAASPGEVYATPGVLDRSLTLFETTALEPFHVKGKQAVIQAYSVGEETGTRNDAEREELPFTGRERELGALYGHIERLSKDAGGVVTVVGERGIGKSRLVSEAVAGLGDTARRVTVRAEPYGTSTPYRAMRDTIRSVLGVERTSNEKMAEQLAAGVAEVSRAASPLLPLIAEAAMVEVPMTPEAAAVEPRFLQDRTADLIREVFERSFAGPVLFEIEDGHWMDEASSHLLSRLSEAGDRLPWLFVVTRRDDLEGFFPSGDKIPLGPLTSSEARDLVVAATAGAPLRPHDLDAVVDRAGGFPLFLEEIVRAVRQVGSVEGLPDSLDAIVSSQIDALEPLARRLLRFASVLGRSFRRDTLTDLLAQEAVDLDPATQRQLAGFLEPDGPDRWRFRHAVLRDAAYQGLSYKRRRELHLRAGEALERSAGGHPEAVAGVLALHYSLAGQPLKTWEYGRMAGDAAREAYGNLEAAEHYERALGAVARGDIADEDQVAEVWTKLGDVREDLGLFAEALDAYRRATRLTPDLIGRAGLLRKRASARERAGSYSAALRELTAARGLIQEFDGPEAALLRADLAAFAASVRQAQEQPRAALEAAHQAASEARPIDAKLALARAYQVMDWAYFALGEPGKAVHGVEALALLEDMGRLGAAASVTNNLGAVAYFDGRWDEAHDYFQRAQVDFTKAGNAVQAGVAGSNVGELLVNQGRLEEAEPMLKEASRVMRASGFDEGAAFAEIHLARVLLERGTLDEAEELLTKAREELAELGRLGTSLEAAVYLADCSLRRGQPAEALAVLDTAVTAAPDEFVMHLANVSRVRSIAHARLGQAAKAMAAFEEGMANATDYGLVYERALLLLAGAAVAAGQGEPPDPAMVGEAERLLSKLGVQQVPSWVAVTAS